VNSLVPFVLFVVAVGALSVTIAERRHGRTTGSRLPLGIALSCSLAAILALTLVPTSGANDRQLVPLVHIIDGLRPPTETDVVLNVVGNALMFLTLGAGLCLLGLRVRTTILIAFSLSAIVEITQLLVPGRTTSVDDLLLNTLGALLGHALLLRWAPVADL
jgi:glycopeptide antibiotics resistance protein